MLTGSPDSSLKVVSLAGGVGGAKMANGFAMAIEPEAFTVIVNTADDFDHLGLRICPDLDTVTYTLAGIANPVTGWGIAGDSQTVFEEIRERGGPDWFLISDRDFATHIQRSADLAAGRTLTEVTVTLAKALGIDSSILPMSDDLVATSVMTAAGTLAFQEYFVRRQQKDDVLGIEFRGASHATASPEALDAIARASILVINPSNPIVSIGPILAIDGYRQALTSTPAARIAVSPIIGGKALKGPADRMLSSLGHDASALGVARIYEGLIDGFVIDHADRNLADEIAATGVEVLVTDIIMRVEEDRLRLATEVLEFAGSIDRKLSPS